MIKHAADACSIHKHDLSSPNVSYMIYSHVVSREHYTPGTLQYEVYQIKTYSNSIRCLCVLLCDAFPPTPYPFPHSLPPQPLFLILHTHSYPPFSSHLPFPSPSTPASPPPPSRAIPSLLALIAILARDVWGTGPMKSISNLATRIAWGPW